MNNLTLLVSFGSRTCEHDVSIISGLQAIEAAKQAGYGVHPLYISKQGMFYTGPALLDIKTFRNFSPAMEGVAQVILDKQGEKGQLVAWPPAKGGLFKQGGKQVVGTFDVVLPVMHGPNGEDGTLQGLLEMLNLPYTSAGVAASAVGMDKILMKLALRGVGIPVVEDIWFTRVDWQQNRQEVVTRVEKALPYPVFVKPANLGSSIGVGKAANTAELVEAIEVAASFDARVLVERGIEQIEEVNCSVLGVGGEVSTSVCEMPISTGELLTFWEKYLQGGGKNAKGGEGMASLARKIPAPISQEMTGQIQQMCKAAFQAIGARGVARVDAIIDKATNQIYVNEVNTIPGSLAFYLWEASGMPFAQLIDKLVESALLAHAQKNESVYAYDSDILSGFGNGGKGKGAKTHQ